jgi:guanyl-specific ribonuclease Sa
MDTYPGSAADPASMNRFLYVEGNPSSLIDPTGHLPQRNLTDGGGCIPGPANNYCGTETTSSTSGPTNTTTVASGCSGYSCTTATTGKPYKPVLNAPKAVAPTFEAPDPTVAGGDGGRNDGDNRGQTDPTVAEIEAWWKQASPVERSKLYAEIYGRPCDLDWRDDAPSSIACLGSDGGSISDCGPARFGRFMEQTGNSPTMLVAAVYGFSRFGGMTPQGGTVNADSTVFRENGVGPSVADSTAAKTDAAVDPAAAKPPPYFVEIDSLPAAEAARLNNTLGHIDAGTTPTGPTGVRWEAPFGNNEGYLPANSQYREYRVAPPPGTNPPAGPYRVVRNPQTGETYYTWTHYKPSSAWPASPPFVQIR